MKKHSFKRILFKCSAALILTFITACLIFAAVFYGATKDVKLDDSKILSPSFTSLQMSDVNGSPIKPSRGAYTPYADIPKNLVNAFVAAEDKRFFEHNGIDIARIIGALKNNIKAGSLKEGASTIDQQLIKNTHLSNEKTFERKVKEIKLALELDRGYSKERIVEAYLNGLYFGCGVYGVTSAAEVFFDKTLTELTVCECAALAAVIKNPYGYSPFNNLKRLYERRDVVLSLMRKNGYIDARQEADALLERLIISDKKPFIDACDSYAECVLEEASKITGLSAKELRLSKYTIRTYYNPDAEKILADAVNNPDYLLKNKNGKTPDAFALLVDNHDGGISAFYINSYIASIYGLRRQPGSIAKPLFVYAPAFKYGIVTPSTVIDDTAREFDGYSPGNYKNKYLGQITVRQAVKYSSNIAAVDVLSRLTVERAKHF
ncbi:MAG: transglycosylase domain-containing protein, partial [Clostridiales bacterium]|nr:transglycosylase domain-containing protein [Clostridiales bacterium]